jgi:hypothetical protein
VHRVRRAKPSASVLIEDPFLSCDEWDLYLIHDMGLGRYSFNAGRLVTGLDRKQGSLLFDAEQVQAFVAIER